MSYFDELGKRIGEIDDITLHLMKKLNINYNHFAVLYSLANAQNGQCSQKQICEEWYLPKQTVFNICKEYKKNGWIELSTSSNDKREKIMRLTELGKEQAQPILHATHTVSERAFAEFGADKTEQLFTLMREFSATFRKKIDDYE